MTINLQSTKYKINKLLNSYQYSFEKMCSNKKLQQQEKTKPTKEIKRRN